MSAQIEVRRTGEDASSLMFDVRVSEGASETRHRVTLARADHERLAGGDGEEDFVRRCFEFLLAREPKESILRRFDVSVIGTYFPEFDGEI